MKLYQRACRILADEGMSGLVQRTARKLRGPKPSDERDSTLVEAISAYEDRRRQFEKRCRELGCVQALNYYWYHTIDLGDGLITPGDYDFRDLLWAYHFPDDMRGMKVLDIGAATGFFSFEFEKRGAEVTAVELPSLADWDMPGADDREQTLRELMAAHQVTSQEEAYRYHLREPFDFCRERLRARVRRCFSTLYDLSPEKLGTPSFDLVFVGAVLQHTFSPLKALATLAPLCHGTMVLCQELVHVAPHLPLMYYVGGNQRGGDNRSWWLYNRLCIEQMLQRLGLRQVDTLDEIRFPFPRIGRWSTSTILHARKEACGISRVA